MPGDYAVLAPIYESIGMGQFAQDYTPQLILYSQTNEWLGRQILDLGCGTGASTRWLAERGYNVTAVDNAPDMIAEARRRLDSSGLSVEWLQADVRALDPNRSSEYDMALALDLMNEINGLQELKIVIDSVSRLLAPDKLFIFDLYTVQGLAAQAECELAIAADSDDLSVTVRQQFDYERQLFTSSYTIFQHRQNNAWSRRTAGRTLRGYPLAAVAALLQRANFGIMALLNLNLEQIDAASMREPRVIFIAKTLA